MTAEQQTNQTPKGPDPFANIKLYGVGYAILLGAFLVFAFTCSVTMKPAEFIEKAFEGSSMDDFEGSFDDFKDLIPKDKDGKTVKDWYGNVRVWGEVTFEGLDKLRYHIPAGAKLLDQQAIAFAQVLREEISTVAKDKQKVASGFVQKFGGVEAQAIALAKTFLKDNKDIDEAAILKFIADAKLPKFSDAVTLKKMLASGELQKYAADYKMIELKRRFPAVVVHGSGTFANLSWSRWFTLYNLFGLFLLMYTVVSSPLAGVLDTGAEDAKQAVAGAEKARNAERELKEKYEALLAEVEQHKKEMEENAKVELEEEREHIMKLARHEAKTSIAAVKQAIETEIGSAAERLRAEISGESIKLAREIVTKKASLADHEKAFGDFVEHLEKAEL